ncbi:MAG: ribosomal RNA small subunit methyltransferase A [Bacilli bacterium]|nr:ribosomal RNA small subunit methyltransferase A [Bacilli bacterium]
MSDFKHKHSLGQNFLKDKNVLTKIIDSVDIKEDDLIIEVGPGQGALTKYLKLFNANLICYEIDVRVKKDLDKYLDNKTKVIFNDFLKANVFDDIKDVKYNNLYIVANLPYYITTPIIEKVINDGLNVKEMVLMVQNEVADRLSAKPGSKDYGSISVLLSYYYDINKLFFVSRKCFDPIPNVDSAVIKFSTKNKKYNCNEKLFKSFVRDCFAMKRKNLRNNLKKYDLNIIEKVLKCYGLDLQCRAEQVPLDCFVDIVNELGDKNDKE